MGPPGTLTRLVAATGSDVHGILTRGVYHCEPDGLVWKQVSQRVFVAGYSGENVPRKGRIDGHTYIDTQPIDPTSRQAGEVTASLKGRLGDGIEIIFEQLSDSQIPNDINSRHAPLPVDLFHSA